MSKVTDNKQRIPFNELAEHFLPLARQGYSIVDSQGHEIAVFTGAGALPDVFGPMFVNAARLVVAAEQLLPLADRDDVRDEWSVEFEALEEAVAAAKKGVL